MAWVQAINSLTAQAEEMGFIEKQNQSSKAGDSTNNLYSTSHMHYALYPGYSDGWTDKFLKIIF